MSPLEQRITTLADIRFAAIADRATNLKAQLFELERLRERVGKAVLSAEKSRKQISCADAKSRSENRRSVSPLIGWRDEMVKRRLQHSPIDWE
jgi:3'-phosphoadenosine 5'-phosphosulfate sulfotransferase (PAPS reductase)/FAD synthetase